MSSSPLITRAAVIIVRAVALAAMASEGKSKFENSVYDRFADDGWSLDCSVADTIFGGNTNWTHATPPTSIT